MGVSTLPRPGERITTLQHPRLRPLHIYEDTGYMRLGTFACIDEFGTLFRFAYSDTTAHASSFFEASAFAKAKDFCFWGGLAINHYLIIDEHCVQ